MISVLLLGACLQCGQTPLLDGQAPAKRINDRQPSSAADTPATRLLRNGPRDSITDAPTTAVPSIPPFVTQTPTDSADEQTTVPEPAQEVAPPAPPAGDRWLLMRALQGTWYGHVLDSNRIAVYGWTEGSITLSSQGPINWPMVFQSPTNQFLLNQNWIVAERAVLASGTTKPTVGFRVDAVVPGSDARFIQQRGLLNGQTGMYQFDIYQFYGEIFIPTILKGLDIKVGRVAVPYMAEVTSNVFNPLFSHTYAYYYNPFTHTGIMTTLKLTDKWSVGGWATIGQDVWFDPAANGMFVGTIQYTSNSQRHTAFTCLGFSSGRFDVAQGFQNQNHIDVVTTHKVTSRFRMMTDSGAGYLNDVPRIGFAYWAWCVIYGIYDLTPRLSAALRFETFDDGQGVKTGTTGVYRAGTAGFTFKPVKSVMIRPEVRFDHNNTNAPFNGQRGLFTAATDVIIRW